MASLALILHDNGYRVAGSDIKQYTFTQLALEKANIPIYEFNKSNNLDEFIDAYHHMYSERNDIKRVVVTPDYVMKHWNEITYAMRILYLYPDYFIDIVKNKPFSKSKRNFRPCLFKIFFEFYRN